MQLILGNTALMFTAGIFLGIILGYIIFIRIVWRYRANQVSRDTENEFLKMQSKLTETHIRELESLKQKFIEEEKQIRKGSLDASRRTLIGKYLEKMVPFISSAGYNPADMQFLGNPVDYVIFKGLENDKVEKIVFLEVKNNSSKLTKREKSVKEAVENKKVEYEELRLDIPSDNNSEQEMDSNSETISDIEKKIEYYKEK